MSIEGQKNTQVKAIQNQEHVKIIKNIFIMINITH